MPYRDKLRAQMKFYLEKYGATLRGNLFYSFYEVIFDGTALVFVALTVDVFFDACKMNN